MRTLGLVGGMSWESTALYYRWINEGVRDALGPLRSAPIVLHSFDFEEIKTLQFANDWHEAGRRLATAAANLEAAGAEAVLLCTNTMHKVAGAVEAAITVPLLHLADATGDRIAASGIGRVALLGTRFTMEEAFYKERLVARGIDVLVPDANGISEINRVIYDELCRGIVSPASRRTYVAIVEQLVAAGAEAVILGCTEITMLVGPGDLPVPSFDTTAIHAEAAVAFAIADEMDAASRSREARA
jgi:aspartate racemase